MDERYLNEQINSITKQLNSENKRRILKGLVTLNRLCTADVNFSGPTLLRILKLLQFKFSKCEDMDISKQYVFVNWNLLLCSQYVMHLPNEYHALEHFLVSCGSVLRHCKYELLKTLVIQLMCHTLNGPAIFNSLGTSLKPLQSQLYIDGATFSLNASHYWSGLMQWKSANDKTLYLNLWNYYCDMIMQHEINISHQIWVDQFQTIVGDISDDDVLLTDRLNLLHLITMKYSSIMTKRKYLALPSSPTPAQCMRDVLLMILKEKCELCELAADHWPHFKQVVQAMTCLSYDLDLGLEQQIKAITCKTTMWALWSGMAYRFLEKAQNKIVTTLSTQETSFFLQLRSTGINFVFDMAQVNRSAQKTVAILLETLLFKLDFNIIRTQRFVELFLTGVETNDVQLMGVLVDGRERPLIDVEEAFANTAATTATEPVVTCDQETQTIVCKSEPMEDYEDTCDKQTQTPMIGSESMDDDIVTSRGMVNSAPRRVKIPLRRLPSNPSRDFDSFDQLPSTSDYVESNSRGVAPLVDEDNHVSRREQTMEVEDEAEVGSSSNQLLIMEQSVCDDTPNCLIKGSTYVESDLENTPRSDQLEAATNSKDDRKCVKLLTKVQTDMNCPAPISRRRMPRKCKQYDEFILSTLKPRESRVSDDDSDIPLSKMRRRIRRKSKKQNCWEADKPGKVQKKKSEKRKGKLKSVGNVVLGSVTSESTTLADVETGSTSDEPHDVNDETAEQDRKRVPKLTLKIRNGRIAERTARIGCFHSLAESCSPAEAPTEKGEHHENGDCNIEYYSARQRTPERRRKHRKSKELKNLMNTKEVTGVKTYSQLLIADMMNSMCEKKQTPDSCVACEGCEVTGKGTMEDVNVQIDSTNTDRKGPDGYSKNPSCKGRKRHSELAAREDDISHIPSQVKSKRRKLNLADAVNGRKKKTKLHMDTVTENCEVTCNTDIDTVTENCEVTYYTAVGTVADNCEVTCNTDIDTVAENCEVTCNTDMDTVPENCEVAYYTTVETVADNCEVTCNTDIDTVAENCEVTCNTVTDDTVTESCEVTCNTDIDTVTENCEVTCNTDIDTVTENCEVTCNTDIDTVTENCEVTYNTDIDTVTESCEVTCNTDIGTVTESCEVTSNLDKISPKEACAKVIVETIVEVYSAVVPALFYTSDVKIEAGHKNLSCEDKNITDKEQDSISTDTKLCLSGDVPDHRTPVVVEDRVSTATTFSPGLGMHEVLLHSEPAITKISPEINCGQLCRPDDLLQNETFIPHADCNATGGVEILSNKALQTPTKRSEEVQEDKTTDQWEPRKRLLLLDSLKKKPYHEKEEKEEQGKLLSCDTSPPSKHQNGGEAALLVNGDRTRVETNTSEIPADITLHEKEQKSAPSPVSSRGGRMVALITESSSLKTCVVSAGEQRSYHRRCVGFDSNSRASRMLALVPDKKHDDVTEEDDAGKENDEEGNIIEPDAWRRFSPSDKKPGPSMLKSSTPSSTPTKVKRLQFDESKNETVMFVIESPTHHVALYKKQMEMRRKHFAKSTSRQNLLLRYSMDPLVNE